MSPKLLFFPFALIIFVWSFIGLTKPTWNEYQSDKVELQKLITEEKTLINGISNIKKALTEFKKIDDDNKKRVYNAMPQLMDNDNLVAEINKNAGESGVMILKLGTNQSKNKNISKCKNNNLTESNNSKKVNCSLTATPIKVSMFIVGTYPMVKDFLSRIDVQNRIIVPREISLSKAKNNQNNSEEQEQTVSDLVSAKINFDVFKKKKNSKIILSKAINNDKVLKSLLTKGLDKKSLQALEDIINSEIFSPVNADNMGKDNLFE